MPVGPIIAGKSGRAYESSGTQLFCLMDATGL